MSKQRNWRIELPCQHFMNHYRRRFLIPTLNTSTKLFLRTHEVSAVIRPYHCWVPRRAMNLPMPITQALVSQEETISRCTARLVRHLTKNDQRIPDERCTLMDKKPKWWMRKIEVLIALQANRLTLESRSVLCACYRQDIRLQLCGAFDVTSGQGNVVALVTS